MKQRTDSQGVPYSYLVDNIKVVLIFLVVFNHLIAFQLVKVDMVVRYVWYGITIFHMPAFIFISGYLSKKPQDVLKNVKNLLIPYILGYSLTWYAYIWTGRSMDYELLRPSGTVMWYVLALFIYRLTIEALGKIRFIVPLSIIFALWAGTRPEFTTYLSSSRIVVFFPFFVAGYLWKSDYTDVVRKFKGKWILLLVSALLLYAVPNFMIANEIPVDIFRGNHTYQLSGMDDITGMLIRLLMYLVSFVLVLTFLACEAAGYLCWKKYHGDLFFPLSDHDRTQRPASSQHPADAECLGAFRSILGACADPWKQAGIFPLRRGTKPAYIYSVQT